MLNVQKYLQNHSLNDLKRNYGIDFRISDHKFLVNYNQLEARSGCKIAEECRGLILRREDASILDKEDIVGDTKILCFGFKRFYNLGDSAAAKIDWESAILQEKVDGTLINLYFDDIKNEWHTATRKVAEGNVKIHGDIFTARELFEKALKETHNITFDYLIKVFEMVAMNHYTFMFELCSPYNQVVCKYETPQIYFLGSRNNKTFEEIYSESERFFNPKTYSLSSIKEIVEFVNKQDPCKPGGEGIVVVDKHFNRIKIKNLSYVTYNKLFMDNLPGSHRNCLTLILEEKVDDLLGKLPPAIEELIIKMQSSLEQYIKVLDKQILEGIQFVGKSSFDKDSDKMFANWVSQECRKNKQFWAAPAFDIFRGHYSNSLDWIRAQRTKEGDYKKTVLNFLLEKLDIK